MKGFFKYGTPIIKLILEDRSIDFLLDTGFNGEIMVPDKLIKKLKLEKVGFSEYLSAAGGIESTNVFKGNLKFFDKEIEVMILSTDADFSLAGMELFHNCKISIERCKEMIEITESK